MHTGISEGMLSGCVGVLPEAVRRQIYIIRTSGARLLALINDVMDAAALRQHRLVLKKERVPLKHLVDDMLDLTRPLVRPVDIACNCWEPGCEGTATHSGLMLCLTAGGHVYISFSKRRCKRSMGT